MSMRKSRTQMQIARARVLHELRRLLTFREASLIESLLDSRSRLSLHRILSKVRKSLPRGLHSLS